MRAMRSHLMGLLMLLFIVLVAAIFGHAGRSADSSMWTVQTSGIDTNLRGVSIAVFNRRTRARYGTACMCEAARRWIFAAFRHLMRGRLT
jgi:hypothetical protein